MPGVALFLVMLKGLIPDEIEKVNKSVYRREKSNLKTGTGSCKISCHSKNVC